MSRTLCPVGRGAGNQGASILGGVLFGLFATGFGMVATRAVEGPSAPHFAVAFATFLGGAGNESVRAVAAGSEGRLWVAGYLGAGPLAGNAVAGTGTCYLAEILTGSGQLGSVLRLPDVEVNCLTLDGDGNVFVGGTVSAGTRWEAVDPLRSATPGATAIGTDGVLIKVASDGRAVLRSVLLGGTGNDEVRALWPDGKGGVFVAGNTESDDFPTARALRSSRAGGRDGFLMHVSAAGPDLGFSTYIGGSRGEEIRSMTRLANGDLVVAGGTGSSDLPGTRVGQQILGGTRDGFVLAAAGDGARVRWSTLVGGPNPDELNAIATDAAGRLVAVGGTESERLDTTAGSDPLAPARSTGRDVLLVRLTADGEATGLLLALGGGLDDEARALSVTADGHLILGGTTQSSDFPVRGAVLAKAADYSGNLFVTELDEQGRMIRSTQWGSRGDEGWGGMALDPQGRVLLGAQTGFVEPGPYLPVAGRPVQGVQGGGYGEGHVAVLERSSAAPAHDRKAEAAELSFREFTAVLNLTGATRDAGERPQRGIALGGSVWWRWKAVQDGWIRVSTDQSEVPVAVSVHDEAGGAGADELPSDPEESDPGQGRFVVRRDGSYLIALAARSEGQTGAASLQLQFSGLPNDDFARRERIAVLPQTRTVDLTQVTGEAEETSEVEVSAGGSVDRSAWWTWTAERTGKYVWRAEGEGGFRPLLQVFRGDVLRALKNVAFYDSATNAPETSNPVAQILFRAEAGEEYQLRAAGRKESVGRARVSLAVTNLPANDDFAGRFRLPSDRRVSATGNLRIATSEPGEPVLKGEDFIYGSGLSLWWAWISPTNGLVRVSTAGSPRVDGSGASDTWLGVFIGGALGSLREVAANDDAAEGERTSALFFRASAGEEYQFYVTGEHWENALGPVMLDVAVVDPPAWVPGAQVVDELGRFRGRVRGLAGVRYEVEAAEAVGPGMEWRRVGEVLAGAEATEFVDDGAIGQRSRCYRIVLPAAP